MSEIIIPSCHHIWDNTRDITDILHTTYNYVWDKSSKWFHSLYCPLSIIVSIFSSCTTWFAVQRWTTTTTNQIVLQVQNNKKNIPLASPDERQTRWQANIYHFFINLGKSLHLAAKTMQNTLFLSVCRGRSSLTAAAVMKPRHNFE